MKKTIIYKTKTGSDGKTSIVRRIYLEGERKTQSKKKKPSTGRVGGMSRKELTLALRRKESFKGSIRRYNWY